MSGPPASNPLDVCGAVVAACIRNALRRQIQNLRRDAVIASLYKERNLIQRHTEAAAMRKENCKGEEHNELPRGPLGGRPSLSSPHQSTPTQLHCVKTRNTSNHRHRKQVGKVSGTPCSSICHNRKSSKQVCQYRLQVRLTMLC
jgi:hypothetical protein